MVTITAGEIASAPGPTYRALADRLADAIAAGRLAEGERLPPQRDLAWKLKVTTGTVGRAYDLLAQRGLVRGEVGRGTYVLERPTAVVHPPLDPANDADVHDLTSNYPAPTTAQARLGDLLGREDMATSVLGDLLRYPAAAGSLRHRTLASAWLAHLGAPTVPERIVITNGAEGALATTLLALARPGDPVLVEQLTYSGLKTLTSRLGQRLEPVATDAEGMLPDALAHAARHTGARLVVLSPSISNPSTVATPLARRMALAEVAREAGLFIMEDEVYGPLIEDRQPAFALLAPERTVYVTSLSKILAPGLRLGALSGPEGVVRELTAVQSAISLGHTPLSAELFASAWREGVVVDAMRQQREEMKARQDLAREILFGLDVRSQPTALHVWLCLPEPWSSAEAALALARTGVMVAPAERFWVGRGSAPRAIRVSLSASPTRAHLRMALRRIVDTLTERGGGPLV
ncbi:MAG: PLP-dependent aminotransferase family protein [Geminicoccaceae bacterium]